MDLNDWINVQSQIVATPKEPAPAISRAEQVNIGLEFAKRQAEKAAPEQKPIPAAGAVPVPN